MFDKKYNIDDLYLVKIGYVSEKTILDYDNILYSQRELSLKGLSYACVKITKKKNKFVFHDVLSNNSYQLFNIKLEDGDVCVSPKDMKRLRSILNHPQFKVVTDKILSKLLAEFEKPKSERQLKELLNEICELNKIKIVKKEKQDTNEKTL